MLTTTLQSFFEASQSLQRFASYTLFTAAVGRAGAVGRVPRSRAFAKVFTSTSNWQTNTLNETRPRILTEVSVLTRFKRDVAWK